MIPAVWLVLGPVKDLLGLHPIHRFRTRRQCQTPLAICPQSNGTATELVNAIACTLGNHAHHHGGPSGADPFSSVCCDRTRLIGEPRSWLMRMRSEERRVGKECRSRW